MRSPGIALPHNQKKNRQSQARGKKPRPESPNSSALVAALMLSALSGAAALMHELLWTRRLVDLIGGTGDSFARVFGCFFLGLAIGSWWGTDVARKAARPWLVCAFAELCVAGLSLPALLLPSWTSWIWPTIGPEALVGPLGQMLKWAISLLIILPPAIAMGMVLPVLAAASVGKQNQQRIIWLYAANIFGGVLGLVLAVAFFLQWLGAFGTMLFAAALNILMAIGCWSQSWFQLGVPSPRGSLRETSQRPEHDPEEKTAGIEKPAGNQTVGRGIWIGLLAAAFFSGAGILAAEVLASQLLALVVTLSFFGPAVILVTVLLVLGTSAVIVPLIRRFRTYDELVPASLMLTGLLLVTLPHWFLYLGRQGVPPAENLWLYTLRLSGLVLAAFGPAFLAAGIVFPAVTGALVEAAGTQATRFWGRLLAINGLGGLCGALGTSQLLLPASGVYLGFGVLASCYAAAALLWLVLMARNQPLGRLGPAGVTLGITLFLSFSGLAKLRHTNPEWGRTVLGEYFGQEGTVTVVGNETRGRSILVCNQYLLGSSAAADSQRRQTHLALVLHPEPRHVCCIGVATGNSPAAALDHDQVESVTAIEISDLVVSAARDHFGQDNRQLFQSQRAHVIVEDGRTLIAASPGRFDVVLGDLFLPYSPGVGRLYTQEHFASVKRSLRPGGLYCQWIPAFQVTQEQLQGIARTFASVFEEVHLFRNDFDYVRPSIALIGYHQGNLDWAQVTRRCEVVREQGHINDLTIRWPSGIALLSMGPWTESQSEPGVINTLDNMWLELDAGRERLTNREYLKNKRWFDFLKRRAQARPTDPAELGDQPRRLANSQLNVHQLSRLGDDITAWQAYTAQNRPVEKTLGHIRLLLPADIARDHNPATRIWPGNPALFDY